MTFYDDVFITESVRDISYIFNVKVSSEKKSLQLKMKRKVLNILIFCESECTVNEYHTSSMQPL